MKSVQIDLPSMTRNRGLGRTVARYMLVFLLVAEYVDDPLGPIRWLVRLISRPEAISFFFRDLRVSDPSLLWFFCLFLPMSPAVYPAVLGLLLRRKWGWWFAIAAFVPVIADGVRQDWLCCTGIAPLTIHPAALQLLLHHVDGVVFLALLVYSWPRKGA